MQQIVLPISPQEAQACLALLDVAIRAQGEGAARAALPIMDRIRQAAQAAERSGDTSADEPSEAA